MTARVALAVALLLALHAAPAAGAGSCTDPVNQALYDNALQQLATCETAVGFPLEPPLAPARTAAVCNDCSALAAATRAKQFGDCTLASGATGATTTLQARMDALFACSPAAPTSGSGSGADDIVTPTPRPSTATPKPAVTLLLPSTSGSDGSEVPTPTTSQPRTPGTAEEPNDSGSGSESTSGTGKGSSGKSRGSGSSSGLAPGVSTSSGSSTSIGLVVGIAAGVVVLVILLAIFIVCRQRRRSQRESRSERFDYSNDGTTPAKHQSVVISTHGGTGSGGTRRGGTNSAGATAGSGTRHGSLSDGFVLPHGSNSGLWDDEAIIAVRIPREKVFSDVLLSRGGYGEVYRGLYNGQAVAVKTLLPERRKDMKQINAFLAEVKLMAALEHAQIVRFIGVAWDSLTDLCVVSEYMEGGDLRSTLTRFEDVEHRRHGFDADKIRIALHIAHALTYLHSLQPIVLHRDLKSKNILLDTQLNAKLTDFGVSRERSDRTMTAGVGSSLWMAPEVMLGERYDEKSDIFSFGVVLSELDSHLLPYAQVTESMSSGESRRIPDTAILQMVSLGRLRVQFSSLADPTMVEIANACVALDPAARPTAADVCYQLHSVLKSYQNY